MLRRYFECITGTSRKFWEVTLSGRDVTVRYGRIGTGGQVQTTPSENADAARQRAEALIRSKLRKGYVETVLR